MTVNQVSCCLLLNKLLFNVIDLKEVCDDTIVCAVDTVIEYITIMDKKMKNIPLIKDEEDFLNNIFYDNKVLLINLSYKIKALINKRCDEVNNFLKLFANFDESQEQKINIYNNLPFRYANIRLENIILGKILDIDYKEQNYLMLIVRLLDQRNNLDNFYSFINFFNSEGLSFECFSKDKTCFKMNGCNQMYTKESLVKLLRNFPAVIGDDYKQVIGQSAEMIVYDDEIASLKKCGRSDLASRVIWVSRDVGDGFGYDILSFDPISGNEKLIEVKGTLYKINSEEAMLTKNEFEFANSISFDENKQFFVYRVYIDRNLFYDIKRVRCLNGVWFDQDNNNYCVRPWYYDYFLNSGVENYKIKRKK